jgi:hypothetical protein
MLVNDIVRFSGGIYRGVVVGNAIDRIPQSHDKELNFKRLECISN